MEELAGAVPRQCDMKVWRIGFMRWRRREGPTGSHQLEARALKWETSVGSTVDFGDVFVEEEVEVDDRRTGGVEDRKHAGVSRTRAERMAGY